MFRPEMCSEQKISLKGHCGYFYQNFSSEYLNDDDSFHTSVYLELLFNFFLKEANLQINVAPIIGFIAIQVQPHLKVVRDGRGFTISGPHYSLLVETAKYLNYRYESRLG